MAKSGEMSISDADKALKKIADEARAVAASRAIELIEYDEEITSEDSKGDKNAAENWLPAVGEEVLIVTMAGKTGTIESLSKNKATVRAGVLSMEVKLTDLRPSRKKPQKPRASLEKYRKERHHQIKPLLQLGIAALPFRQVRTQLTSAESLLTMLSGPSKMHLEHFHLAQSFLLFTGWGKREGLGQLS
eukprot:jgi/Picre1/35611/NNA_003072.t1